MFFCILQMHYNIPIWSQIVSLFSIIKEKHIEWTALCCLYNVCFIYSVDFVLFLHIWLKFKYHRMFIHTNIASIFCLHTLESLFGTRQHILSGNMTHIVSALTNDIQKYRSVFWNDNMACVHYNKVFKTVTFSYCTDIQKINDGQTLHFAFRSFI